jgi:hypothetical protein
VSTNDSDLFNVWAWLAGWLKVSRSGRSKMPDDKSKDYLLNEVRVISKWSFAQVTLDVLNSHQFYYFPFDTYDR